MSVVKLALPFERAPLPKPQWGQQGRLAAQVQVQRALLDLLARSVEVYETVQVVYVPQMPSSFTSAALRSTHCSGAAAHGWSTMRRALLM